MKNRILLLLLWILPITVFSQTLDPVGGENRVSDIKGGAIHRKVIVIPESDNTSTYANVPNKGRLRINSSTNKLEYHDGSGWKVVTDNSTGVNGVKGNNESSFRNGNVNLTAANIGAAPADNVVNKTGQTNQSVAGTLNVADPRSSNTSITSADQLTRKDYVDALVTGIIRLAGNWSFASSSWPTLGTGPGGSIKAGDSYIVSVGGGGTAGGKTFTDNESFYAIVDNPGQNANNWARFNIPVGQATAVMSGILKLYTGTGTATDGTMTQNSITNQLSVKAPLLNPNFSGIPTGPTAPPGTNTTQLATTEFVITQMPVGPILQGGNSFGVDTPMIIGTNDDNDVNIIREGITKMSFFNNDIYIPETTSITTTTGTDYKMGTVNQSFIFNKQSANNQTAYRFNDINSGTTGSLITFDKQGTPLFSFQRTGRLVHSDAVANNESTTLGQVNTLLATKQNTLVSGTNIKTIETQDITGSGNIDLDKSDVGLNNVDNTSDLNKPVSTAQATINSGKANTNGSNATGTWSNIVAGNSNALGGYSYVDATTASISHILIRETATNNLKLATPTGLAAAIQAVASGNWNINSATSTAATNWTRQQVSDFNTPTGFALIQALSGAANRPGAGVWGTGIQFTTADNSLYLQQLVFDVTGVGYTRVKDNGTWNAWQRFSMTNVAETISAIKTFTANNIFQGTTTFQNIINTTDNITIQGNNKGLFLGNSGNNGSILYNTNGNLDITPRSTFHTTFPSGNVIIGNSTATPTQKLVVDGEIIAQAGTASDRVVIKSQLDLKANIAAPTFTGDAKAVTPAASDNDTSIATTEFVKTAVNNSRTLEAAINLTSSTTINSSSFGSNGVLTIYANASSGAIIITLPAHTSMLLLTIFVIKTDASANTVTIAGLDGVNINGSNTYPLTARYQNACVKSNSTQYYLFN